MNHFYFSFLLISSLFIYCPVTTAQGQTASTANSTEDTVIILSTQRELGASSSSEISKKNIRYINSIFATVNINGSVSGNFLFDTGSPVTLFDSTFVAANNIELKEAGTIPVSGSGNSAPVQLPYYENPKVNAFGQLAYSQLVLVYDLKKIIPVEDGIIGFDYFYDNIVKIDYKHHRLSLVDKKEKIDASYKKYKLEVIEGKMYVRMDIEISEDKTVSGLFLIDTGFEMAISIDRFYADSLNFYADLDKIEKNVKNGGIGGAVKSYLIKANNARIGKYSIDDVLVNCSRNSKGKSARKSKVRVGKIGNLYLEKFDIVIDCGGNSIYMRPNSNYNRLFTYVRAGISLGKVAEGGFLVRSVLNKSAASNVGIISGDIIHSIAGQKTSELGYYQTRRLLEVEGDVSIEIIRQGKTIKKALEIQDMMEFL